MKKKKGRVNGKSRIKPLCSIVWMSFPIVSYGRMFPCFEIRNVRHSSEGFFKVNCGFVLPFVFPLLFLHNALAFASVVFDIPRNRRLRLERRISMTIGRSFVFFLFFLFFISRWRFALSAFLDICIYTEKPVFKGELMLYEYAGYTENHGSLVKA